MHLIFVLLFSKVIATPIVLYQPADVIYVDEGTTAQLPCVSSERLEAGTLVSWYRKSWRTGGNISLVKSCVTDNDQDKYVCSNSGYRATLQIRNTQTNDSGVYYCTYYYQYTNNIMANGTALIVQDSSTSQNSIHLFVQHLLPNHLMLSCVAHEVRHIVNITWIISGAPYKGKTTSIQISNEIWTFMNIVSVSKDTLNNRNQVSCKVQFNSSTAVVIHRQITGPPFNCKSVLTSVLTLGLLLLLTLSIHLLWIYKRTDKISNISDGKNRSQDEITYAQLNMNHLNKRRK